MQTKCLALNVWIWSDKGWPKLNTSHRYAKRTLKNCMKALFLVWMIQKSFKTNFFIEVMMYCCRPGKQNLCQLKKTFFIQHVQHPSTIRVQSNGWTNKKPPGRWQKFRWRFDVWKTLSKLFCGFLRVVSKAPKSLDRAFFSAPKEKRLHLWGCLVQQFIINKVFYLQVDGCILITFFGCSCLNKCSSGICIIKQSLDSDFTW